MKLGGRNHTPELHITSSIKLMASDDFLSTRLILVKNVRGEKTKWHTFKRETLAGLYDTTKNQNWEPFPYAYQINIPSLSNSSSHIVSCHESRRSRSA